MKITCQSCQSKYTVSDEKVQGKTVKIKCRKCGATIVVNSSGATNGSGVADPVSVGGSEGNFLVNVTEGDQRSMSLQEIVTAYHTQVVTADTYVWADGMGDWQPLSQVDAIVAALNSGATPAVAEPTPAPESVEVPSRAAAVRRDPARRQADLFGGGMGAVAHAAADVGTSSPLFNGSAAMAPVASPSATGQRDDNSVLFSLSALTAKAASAPSSPGKTTATKDDSGLIDLKALAASSGSSGQPTNLVSDHAGGLFPLGAPAAPVSAQLISVPPAPAKSKAPIFIALGGVVALAAIVGAFFAMKGGGETAMPTAAPTVAAAPPLPTAEPAATAAVESTAAVTASAASTAAPKVAKGGPRGAPAGAKPAGAAAAPAKPPDVAPGPKKPATGNCGCASGDLMCAMNCSAKGH